MNPAARSRGCRRLIDKLDEQIARFDRGIPMARDRKELESLQRRRLEMLEERGDLEDLLVAVRMGIFEANESRLPDEVPDVPHAPGPMPAAEPCPDDDCDRRVD
ncbi:MAG TPA: hypothetical protein VM261_29035 [Kofleriaceae bacterium]|nr:hypothetical protein [Kofleriaceae bacterium]